MNKIFVLIALLALAIAGCSAGPLPSDRDARTEFDRMVQPFTSKRILEVVSFKKTDGQRIENNGSPIYVIEYEVQVRFLAAHISCNPPWASSCISGTRFGIGEV